MMDVTIETPRLILRQPTDADVAPLSTMWADPRVMANLGPVKSAADSLVTLARHAQWHDEGLGFRAVVLRDGGATIGFCGLKRGEPGTPIAGEIEAGWMIAADHWGRGHAGEAMRAMMAWGWANTDAPRIVAITAARNAASRAMMEKLGMVYQAGQDFIHPARGPDSPLSPTVLYAIARP